MMSDVVIVGAGQAGFQTAYSLRTEGFVGSITLIGEEQELPYNRPPLSKAFLMGKEKEDDLPFRPVSFFVEHGITLMMGWRVNEVKRADKQVLLDGDVIAYNHLVIATGARVRPITREPIAGLLYLRTTADARECKARMEAADSMIAIGSGFIGLEAAAAAAKTGKRVTVVAAEDRPMGRVVSPLISERFRRLHEEHGVRMLLGEAVDRVEAGLRVHLKSGVVLEAPLVIAGIGVIPNAELAQAAGLETANGIIVDQYLRTTNDQSIYAIGDCANLNGLRLESVQTAVDQARCVAAGIAGKPHPYHAVPWFWTEQFEQKLQIAGIPTECVQFVPRGDSVYGFRKDETLGAVESVNRPVDHIQARKLLETKVPLKPSEAADMAFDLKALTRTRPL